MIQAKVIADSKNEFGNRITTMIVTMPRIILAEFNTHRMLSKNSASSRAIPFKKMVKSVQENPFIPIAWQKDHSGMQGTEYLSKTDKFSLDIFICSLITTLSSISDKESKEYKILHNEIEEKVDLIESILKEYKYQEKTLDDWWLFARDKAVETACVMYVFRTTKQLCNRLLEPFMWHSVIVTATEWENFFALRCPKYKHDEGDGDFTYYRSKKDIVKQQPQQYYGWTDLMYLQNNEGQAEIHMMALAEAMWDAYNENTPKKLKAGEWHIPFGNNIENLSLYLTKNHKDFEVDQPNEEQILNAYKIKIATARCARISYTVVGEEGKEPNYENDIKLHDKLANDGHWSPFEHCAQVMETSKYLSPSQPLECWSGNFKGFTQYRKMFNNENKTL